MRKKYLLPGLILIMLLYFRSPDLAQVQTSFGEIAKNLTCTCDCNMTIDACVGSMNCQSAEKLAVEAKELIQKGMDKNQILASFVGKYGEQILAAPTKKGFNLIVWILPFIVIFIVGFVIIKTLRFWVRRVPEQNIDKIYRNNKHIDSVYEKKLDDTLRNLD